MQEDRRFLRWCLSQSKGIRQTKPSESLVKAYLEKSRSALRSMEVNAKAGIAEWAVSASYYARYFAVYALLSKVGVKCEIHDCTITLFTYLFGDNVPSQLAQELKQSKDERIEMQYYTREIKVRLDQVMNQAKIFVLEIEKIMDSLNSERIALLHNRLKQLTASSRRR